MGIYQDIASGNGSAPLDLSHLSPGNSTLPAYDPAVATTGINNYLSSLPEIARQGMLWERDNPFFQSELVKHNYSIGENGRVGTNIRRASTPQGYEQLTGGQWYNGKYMVNNNEIDQSKMKYDPAYGLIVESSAMPEDDIGHQGNKFLDALPIIAALAVGIDASGLMAAGAGGGGGSSLGAGLSSGLTTSEFAMADIAQLMEAGLTKAQAIAVMEASGTATGGALVGSGGVLGSTGYEFGDSLANALLRNELINSGKNLVTGNDLFDNAGDVFLGTGIGMGVNAVVPSTGVPFVDSGVRGGLTKFIQSGDPESAIRSGVTGGLSSGVSSNLRDAGVDRTVAGVVGSGVSSVANTAMRPNKPQRAQRPTRTV